MRGGRDRDGGAGQAVPAVDVHRGVVQAVTSGPQGGEELGECAVRAAAGGRDRFVSGVRRS
ncbi:hypothetical protein ABT255_17200, partial [Streptomyces mirabilis]|uniref:hypothetical protein n=1 Tax=Streptomyces mirabilis TaxID=68239 RepID=UPI00332D914E